MKVKELIAKMNYCSTLPIRMKRDVSDSGVLLAWRYQDVLLCGNCTVSSFTINKEEMVIYYQVPKNN